jgi:hypothetical protein
VEKLSVVNSSSESSKHDGRRAPIISLLVVDGDSFDASCLAPDTVDTCASETADVTQSFSDLHDSGIANTSPMPPPLIEDSPVVHSSDSGSLSCLPYDGQNVSPLKVKLTRLPPDGCETVAWKLIENGVSLPDFKATVSPLAVLAKQPVAVKCQIPSDKSAFCPPLLEKYISYSSLPSMKLSPVSGSLSRQMRNRNCENPEVIQP